MTIYVFGNQDDKEDDRALQLIKVLGGRIQNLEFRIVKPNEDLPFAGDDEVVIMDVVKGLTEVTLLTEKDFDKLKLSPRNTAHDYDLGWQLRYLMKLGKLKQVRIIGIPMEGRVGPDIIKKILTRI
jgi:Ni,Fe-hydrogenase maturation factor